ncbi:hypothetical protein GDO81_006965 [Engystomops pustulosus]|uniref:Secreted protein n=1 Tax=Engystomops pustulosus TaxID=76066 RepID=A0AAV7D2C8_ENGPU|nr:hypothetical protein GDO81_006965 [Engystomops pustulosus]
MTCLFSNNTVTWWPRLLLLHLPAGYNTLLFVMTYVNQIYCQRYIGASCQGERRYHSRLRAAPLQSWKEVIGVHYLTRRLMSDFFLCRT